jgi:SAM-dependent methyltransferase
MSKNVTKLKMSNKTIKTKIHRKLLYFGFDLKIFLKRLKLYEDKNEKWWKNDLKELTRQKGDDQSFVFGKFRLITWEINEPGGTMTGHYFHQDLYVASQIYLAKPLKHLDIGSQTNEFVAHVAAFREIFVADIRPIKSKVKNINFRQADLMNLPNDWVESFDSVSSLHAIEHFGLGRYGDPIDYYGHLKAIENIHKILSHEGVFYFSVPIGTQRIEFNAHRVFSLNYLIEKLHSLFSIKSFSFVDDKGDFHENVGLITENIESNCGCEYGCGIFTLIKR